MGTHFPLCISSARFIACRARFRCNFRSSMMTVCHLLFGFVSTISITFHVVPHLGILVCPIITGQAEQIIYSVTCLSRFIIVVQTLAFFIRFRLLPRSQCNFLLISMVIWFHRPNLERQRKFMQTPSSAHQVCPLTPRCVTLLAERPCVLADRRTTANLL